MSLNREELVIGGMVGLCFFPIVGLWAFPLALVTSLLWAWAGAGGPKLARRLGVPLLCCLTVYAVHHNVHVFLSVPLAWGVLCIGYGIQDSTDSGSALGRFWYRLSPRWANVLTRGTIYSLLIIAFLIGVL